MLSGRAGWAYLSLWYATFMAHTSTKLALENYSLRLGNRGRLVLPSKLRRRLRLRDGDRMIVTVEADGAIRLRTVRDVVARLAGSWKHLVPPGVSLADELIRERRAEARREAEKFGS